ncbi:MAG: sterol desaturase family protein [Bacteroidota bacterium]
MSAYVAVLNYAIPFFIVLLLIEALVAKAKGASVIRSMDTLSSLSSGITNATKDVLGLTLVIISYAWLEARVGLFDIESTWIVYVIAFIGVDFAGYWIHRLSHQVNYFWNHHIIHHSSEEFNLGCALRQTISAWFSISFFFLLPTAILGVPPEVIAIVQPLHLFAQYWYHTRLIGKMGVLEHVIVTPSHHRVHHAINPEYMDKNLGQIFIFWDRLFGTYQEELEDVPPVYGVKRPARTWNPILINFMHLWLLIKDAWHTQSYKDKFRIWFMPTGWRPADVSKRYPVEAIEDVYHYEKYDPQLPKFLKTWSWVQFVITFASMMYMFNRVLTIGYSQGLLYGLFIGLSIFSYTTLMDRHRWAIAVEMVRVVFGAGIVAWQGDWFSLGTLVPFGSQLVLAYFATSLVLTFYFTHKSLDKEVPSQAMA